MNSEPQPMIQLGGAGPMTREDVQARLRQGWRAVRFEFCMSFVIATVRRQSPVYLTETWQQRYIRGMVYNVLALALGPWGVPWGLVWTARALWANFTGGVDVSGELLADERCG